MVIWVILKEYHGKVVQWGLGLGFGGVKGQAQAASGFPLCCANCVLFVLDLPAPYLANPQNSCLY